MKVKVMTRSMKAGVIGTALFALSGCSTATHAVCVSADTTQTYAVQWREDLAAARWAGTVGVDTVKRVQFASYERLGLLKNEKWSAFCSLLDELRDDAGF